GRVGTLVAQKAIGLGMKVITYDPYVSTEKCQKIGVSTCKSLDEVLEQADFISINLPKTKETTNLLKDEKFEKMKDGVSVINTARGGIFKEETLIKYIENKKVKGAAIDVFENEPCCDSPLFAYDNVIVTPHLGASTLEAQDKAGTIIAEQVIAGLKSDFVSNAVNIPMVAPEALEVVKPFLPLAEILGKMYYGLSEDQLQKLEVEYSGQIASLDTRLLTVAILKGLFESIVEEPVSYVNAPIFAEERGIEVKEAKTTEAMQYVNSIAVSDGKGEVKVSGTLIEPGNKPRIVKIYDYEVDVAPTRYLLIVNNKDQPGMIGKLGTILGNNNINIGGMQFGRKKVSGDAISILSIDDMVSKKVIDEIEKLDGVYGAKLITI
ncbi:MAG: phosphoglycerate dehydrogenase, partial [Actinomycetia bacterium]|nr:phosphoglycerate dehydrogenase [Actinomycetes bacterium]